MIAAVIPVQPLYGLRAHGGGGVAAWRSDRFEATYAGLTAIVLLADGTEAPGQMQLGTVRETYG